ncbi:MAG: glycosyltransferase, partial [Bacteroidia bacterium]|nr:glycosyltransferase [Bacteroidia bacterium]
ADYRLYVQRLLSDESLYRSMAEAGYAFVKTHYNWEHAVQQVSGTLQRLLAEGKNPH